MSEIKETLLQKNFIDAAIELAKIQTDPKFDDPHRQKEKDLRMNMVWKKFKRFIDENYEEK